MLLRAYHRGENGSSATPAVLTFAAIGHTLTRFATALRRFHVLALVSPQGTHPMPSRTRLAAAMGATAVASLPASVIASTYVVHPGDTLTAIALRHGTTVSALAAANQLADPNLIRAGQLLQIPDARVGTPGYITANHDSETHTVVAGDTLISIARHYGLDLTALARNNGLNVNAPLHVGAVLHVPGRIARVNALLTHAANQVGVDPRLVRAVAWMESGWKQDVVSPTGAIGLMQVEPYTGDWVSRYLAGRTLNLRVAADNVTAGSLLLHHLLGVHHGDVSAALAAYYQGDGSIARHGLYDDTRRYQRVVLELMKRE
jgi:LysM repeat protein